MANLTEFIESIQEKSLRTKIVILVAIIVVISGIYWYFLWSPRAEQLESARNKLERLQKKLEEYELIAKQLPMFELEFKRLNREFEIASLKLPKEKEIPTLIDGVYSQVSASGLEPINFVPKGEAKKDIYAEIPIQMKVAGSYLQLTNFFERISNLPRIVNVRDLKLSRDTKAKKANDIVLNADFTTVTFRVLPVPEGLEGTTDTGRQKRKRTPKK
ncbi:MAG: type 4a pilus biogenesis protein PilO [Deltaproteobacteria bacterium]|nr:type 4a pilus biogenesis protein PilO [Deltaproteobacteria bacterium]